MTSQDRTIMSGKIPSGILTFSGKFLDYLNPDPEQIDIEDIAIALSREARFCGHTKKFYSVAQHSVFVSKLLPPIFSLEGLLHDASEAYCKDLPTPLKNLLPDYQAIEERVDGVIRKKFGLPPKMSIEVKAGDHAALMHEMGSFTEHNIGKELPRITPLSSAAARISFLKQYRIIATAS